MLLNGIVFTGTYDALHRRTGFGASHSCVPIVSQAYTYDAASRLTTASMGTLSGSYTYHPNSALIHTLTFKSGTTTVATSTKTFDALNRLTQIVSVSANGTTAPVSHGYTLNALGQRTRVDLADGGYWLYGYNAKGEVVSGIRHDNTGTPIANQSFGYNFDDIGNRNVATIGSGTTTYTANRLNQYTRIATASGTATLQHDADGNLLNNGTWTYTWDAEHRLVSATSGTTSVSFVYDSQSRRIAKTTAAGTIRFIYDEWNLTAEIDNTNSPIRRHLWGLDLSGSPQGAGGVGGLIATSLASGGAHFMAFDGNGNVFATINAADSTHSARFEYDPFGGTTSATGAAVPLLPFRFSTKYQDTETGLYYHGYRYYSPTFGRWISRDPIEEEDQPNLYSVCQNDPVNNWDPVGLETYGYDIYTPDTAFTAYIVALKSITPLDRQLMMHWLFGGGRDYNVFNSDVIQPAGLLMDPYNPDKSQWTLDETNEGKMLISKVCANQRGAVYPEQAKFRTAKTHTVHHAMIGEVFMLWNGIVYACNNRWYYIGDTGYNDDRFDGKPIWAKHRDFDGNVATFMIALMNLTTSATPFDIKFRGAVNNSHDGKCP